jgi:steroid delta-isomerase
MSDAALQSLARFWETLTRESVAHLDRVYADDAHFRDPFNDVRGASGLKRILMHMFDTLEEPRFTIREAVREGSSAFLVWDFDFRVKAWKPGTPRRIHGSSHIRFAPDGRVAYHRDYWDAAGELYAHLPVIGPVVRWLGRKLGR